MATMSRDQWLEAKEEADLVIQGEARPSSAGGSWSGIKLGQNNKTFQGDLWSAGWKLGSQRQGCPQKAGRGKKLEIFAAEKPRDWGWAK